MSSTRRFFAMAALGAIAALPAAAWAQSDPGADDLMRRVRGAPGSRVGGATRGMRRDEPAEAPTPPHITHPPRNAAPPVPALRGGNNG